MASRRPASSLTQAEVVLLPNLRNCLVNLPSALVGLLTNVNAVVQNVIIEIQFKQALPAAASARDKANVAPKSVFFGWTGMQSQTRRSLPSTSGRQLQDGPTVEIDATFGKLVGLTDGAKVSVMIHLDPPQAHTINIEPLTPTDWEIIELHARFLEMNFITQVRALPNPTDSSASHPITLHLSPTSTASIIITSLTPAVPAAQPFVKLAPDAEVIVAPKVRQPVRSTARDSQSVTSAGRRSAGGRSNGARSTGGGSRHRTAREEEKTKPSLFLRGISRELSSEWFDDHSDELKDDGLRVWVDRDHLLAKSLRGVTWVTVSIMRPAGLQEVGEVQGQDDGAVKPAIKVVARLSAWEDAPDTQHAALSTLLCGVLGCPDLVGGIVRIDPAPNPLPRTASAMKDPSQQASKDAIVKRLRITPFATDEATTKAGALRFGGDPNVEKTSQQSSSYFAKTFLAGPLTDGMLLPATEDHPSCIVDFEPPPPGDPNKQRTHWLMGSERKLDIAMQPQIAPPKLPGLIGEPLNATAPKLVGIEDMLEKAKSNLLHRSSVLLTGGLGSGKTSITQVLGHELRRRYLFNVTYLACRTMVTEETRIKTIKEDLKRCFATAAWGARLGGRSLLVLDDLDRLCPAETELQVDANGRSRQVSELLGTLVKQYCRHDQGVVLLATAQNKEALHNLIVGGHLVREVVALKAPNKEGRRKVLEMLIEQKNVPSSGTTNASEDWMEHEHVDDEDGASEAQQDESNLDLLDIAGQTDGYMAGDLAVLVSRARSEALIRAVSEDSSTPSVTLRDVDFAAAIKGFTPASLRGVTLQSSTTTFASIGGLRETRQTLLETLQYPTTYAPLFSKCPLRLRSGLLLYGYPGCGKTLLASAVAGECGLNFISVKGPEILNKYIGASEKSVRDLFERAEAAKPCILFFDEFDSIAPKRGHDSTGVTDRVVNMLLTMMDGAEGLSGVYVLAATSRPDLIDPALLRPGRLDKSLICDMPSEEDRMDILRAVGAKLKFDNMVLNGRGHQSLVEVARRTQGYSGADLQAVVYNAHLEAIHDVLGSTEDIVADYSKKKSSGPRGAKQDFTYFRLGEDAGQDNSVPLSTIAAERAQIAAKLTAMQLARKKARQERHTAQGRPLVPMQNGSHEETQEPVISWRHLAKSLESTRSSISSQEQRRLAAIYHEFMVGRNGDMADGQATTQIGGRTSLM
ncbi:hypothetical protein AMS68_005408 [Peltaster fructicola]|uniref:Peroxisomal ATPase PEX1 n=1 Tax=Peltaster fructicola TaxID=286661 RepID=A0A6H0XYZ8_9PEZI|nr:hypothetical protein AMS68_005408 [Peltaster fructicola]